MDGVLRHRDDERRLIRELLVRDRNAWRQFVENYQGVVRARVARTAVEIQCRLAAADIDDICADVFAGLLANDLSALRRFEGRSSLATWLSVVARRVCLRWFSKRRANTQSIEMIVDAADDAAVRRSPADVLGALVADEDAERLVAMMNQLSEGDQIVLKLFYLQGCTYAEIATHLRISINSVGAKLNRAQRRLRQLLEPEEVAHSDPS